MFLKDQNNKKFRKSIIIAPLVLIFALPLPASGFALVYTVTYIPLKTVLPASPGQEYPSSIAFDLNDGNTYALDPFNDTVQIISGQNDTVTGTISLDDPSHNRLAVPIDIAFDPKNGQMYIATQTLLANFTTGNVFADCAIPSAHLKCSVFVINDKNNRIINTIPIEGVPSKIAFNPNNSHLYVLNQRGNSPQGLPGKISVIDPKNDTVIKTVGVGIGMGDLKIGFNPSNGNSYVINQGFGYNNGSKGSVSVIDPKNDTVIRTIPAGVLPLVIGFNPNNANAYVGNQDSRTVSVIDPKNDTVIRTIPVKLVEGVPTDVVFNPKDGNMHLAVGLPNSIKVIDAKNIINNNYTIFLKGIPNNIALNPNNGDMYVSNSYPDIVSVLHAHNYKAIESIPLKMQTLKVDFNPTNGHIYVTNKINNTIAVIKPGN